MDAGNAKQTFRPETPPEGYRRLSRELAEEHGISYRQLYDRIREGKIPEAVQVKSGGWYLPPEIGIPRVRARITPEIEDHIRRELAEGRKPAAIAKKHNVGERTVYNIKERHYEVLAEDERQRLEEYEHLKGTSEVKSLHIGSAAIVGTDLAEANQEVLKQLVKFEEVYFNPSRNVFHVVPKKVREIVEWQDSRQKRLEEIYRLSTAETSASPIEARIAQQDT